MNKSLLKKIGLIIIIMVILRISLIISLNYINIHSSRYIETQSNEIIINEKLDNHLYNIVDSSEENLENKVLYIKSANKLEFSLLINNLTFLHRVYINDQLVSQNITRDDINYYSAYAYKVFDINNYDYIDNTVKISITGNRADKTDAFLSKNVIIKDSRELRTIIHVVFLVFLFGSTLISLVLYYYNKNDYYFLIFSFMGIISIFKALVLGELFVFAKFLGITAQNYIFLDNLTSFINTILPLVIMYYLFDFKLKSKYISIGLITFLLLGFFILTDVGNFRLYGLLLLIILIVGNIIVLLAFMKDQSYSIVIMINDVVYSSCVLYYILVLRGIFPSGKLLFFMNLSYLGVVVYMAGFLLAILLKHLDKVRVLEKNKREYERVLLLRGISHDLKLPLSVIKLNNQMIDKYYLTGDEIKEYAQTNLEATLELEKMIENINSYLSIKQISATGKTTSVKECFEKMRHYYSFYNLYEDCKFTVECDEKDYKLDINPLNFCRMLYNLVDNAFKYNKGEVQVTVSYKIDKKLLISIEDNGMGMDKTEINRIFEPFYRIDYCRNDGGLGLGLSVVREVVDSLRGTIEIESEKGVGMKIIIAIPI